MSEQRGVILGDWLWISATVWLVIGLALFFGCGCATSQPTEHYPFPVMLDPVTEATPHVHVK